MLTLFKRFVKLETQVGEMFNGDSLSNRMLNKRRRLIKRCYRIVLNCFFTVNADQNSGVSGILAQFYFCDGYHRLDPWIPQFLRYNRSDFFLQLFGKPLDMPMQCFHFYL